MQQTKITKAVLALLVVASLILASAAVAFAQTGTSTGSPAGTSQDNSGNNSGDNSGNSSGNSSGDNSGNSSSGNSSSNAQGGSKQSASSSSGDTGTGTAGSDSGSDTGAYTNSTPQTPSPYYPDRWVTIQPGEQHWYAFGYAFDDSSDSQQTDALIKFTTNPPGGAKLVLLNREQMRDYQAGNGLKTFGAATTENVIDSSGRYAQWSGKIDSSGTYYILIRYNPRVSGPVQYKLNAQGDGLAMK